MKEGLELHVQMDELQRKRIEEELFRFIVSVQAPRLDHNEHVRPRLPLPRELARKLATGFANEDEDRPNTTFAENALLLNFLRRMNETLS